MKNIFTLVSKICVVLFGILTALVFTAGSIMNTNAAAVSNFLNAKTQIVVEDEEAEDIDNVYYKTDYSSVEEERKTPKSFAAKCRFRRRGAFKKRGKRFTFAKRRNGFSFRRRVARK